jgi:phage shock protein A
MYTCATLLVGECRQLEQQLSSVREAEAELQESKGQLSTQLEAALQELAQTTAGRDMLQGRCTRSVE